MGIPYLTAPEKHAIVDYERSTLPILIKRLRRIPLGIALVNDNYYTQPKYHFNKSSLCLYVSLLPNYRGVGTSSKVCRLCIAIFNPQSYLRNGQPKRIT